jgi:hypothetical protein
MRPQKDTNRVKPANPKSFVWQHYEDVNDGKHVFCLLCAADTKQQMYQVTDNNTTSLRDHLETKHIPEWRDLKAHEVQSDPAEGDESEEVMTVVIVNFQ